MKGAMQSRVAKKFPEKFPGPIETELGIDFKMEAAPWNVAWG
jgi:hypothetical protein